MNKVELLQIVSLHRVKLLEEHKNPGWNLWVLYGALASLTWLLISLLETNKYILNSAIFLSLTLYFIYNFSLRFKNFISNNFKNRKGKYVYIKNEISNYLPTLIFSLISFLFIYYFITTQKSNIPLYQLYLLKTSLFSLFVIYSLVFILSLLNFPIQSNPNNSRTKRIINIFVFLVVFLLSEVNPILIIRDELPKLNDFATIKLGLVFFALHFIIFKIISGFEPNSLLEQIDELINDITFDQKTVSDGESTLKLIIYGLQFNNIISPLIVEQISFMKIHKEKCDLIIDRFKKLKLEKDITQRNLLVDSVTLKISELEVLNKNLSKLTSKIQRNLVIFNSNEENNPEYIKIKNLIETLEIERNMKLRELQNESRIV